MKTEIERVINIIQCEIINGDLVSIEAVNVGSYYKSKDQIIDSVLFQTQETRQFLSFCLTCIQFLTAGHTFEEFVNFQLEESQRASTMKSSKELTEKLLSRLAPDMLEFKP